MADSILDSVKKALGVDENYKVFDADIVMHINTTLFTLNQLGIGPSSNYLVSDSEDTWDEYFSFEKDQAAVKSYVYIKVRLLFDPPSSSFILTSMENTAKELEWRLNVHIENKNRAAT